MITGFLAGEVDATSLTKHQTLDIAVAVRGRRALRIAGGDGDDIIHGALNGKVSGLVGGAGDDTLVGEGGQTTFAGGLGSDRIVFKGDDDQASFTKADSSPDAYDVIEGFRGSFDGARNRLLLYIDSDETKRGYQHDFHLGATPGRVGDIIIHYDAAIDHTIVDVFTNTDDTPDFTLHLTGDIPLALADFAI